MLNKFEASQAFEVQHSQLLKYFIVLIHVLSLHAAINNSLNVAIQLILIMLILASLVYYIKMRKLPGNFIVKFNPMVHASEAWEINYPGQQHQKIEILPTTVLTPYCIFLQIRLKNGRKTAILIVYDAMQPEQFRKLLVSIKIHGPIKEC